MHGLPPYQELGALATYAVQVATEQQCPAQVRDCFTIDTIRTRLPNRTARAPPP